MAGTANSKPQLFSGARGIIQYGKPDGTIATLAFATDISVNERENLRPTYVVGALNPVSIEPLSIDVDCSIGRVIPINPPDKSGDKNQTATISAQQLGLEELVQNILTAEAIDIIIMDGNTGADGKGQTTIAKIRECRFSGRTMSNNAGDIGQERLNFTGIYDAGYGGANKAEDTGYGTFT